MESASVPAGSVQCSAEFSQHQTLYLSTHGGASSFTRLGLFDDVTTLHTFDVSDNNEINISDLNATIKAVCRSPELSTLRLSNLNITDLSYMLAPLRETGTCLQLYVISNEPGLFYI